MPKKANNSSIPNLIKSKNPTAFETLSSRVSKATGSTGAFITALLVILVWLISGPIFHFSDTWQLVINTGTTIITFLMVFLIQRSQNKDFVAMHLKLNELIVAQTLASNRMVSIEDISEDDLRVLQEFYKHLAQLAQKEISIESSHSLSSADQHHRRKNPPKKEPKARTNSV
jgi:low affinity Fe/Cu permease